MQEIPGDLKFNTSHEWARVEDAGTVTVGISDHAQGALGDLVYVELPSVGDTVKAGNACAVVESVKAASDIYSPVSGEIVAVNAALAWGLVLGEWGMPRMGMAGAAWATGAAPWCSTGAL